MRRLSKISLLLALSTFIFTPAGVSRLSAQQPQKNTSVATLSSISVVFPGPTVSDYLLGYIDAPNALPFVFNATKGNQNLRTVTVSIYTTVSSLGGAKPSSDLLVKLATQAAGSYQAIPCCSAPGATVDNFSLTFRQATDPYSNSLDLRMLLNAGTDAPQLYTTGATGITIVFSQVAP